MQAPSVSCIADIITTSSLSNDDINDLIDQLLDKMKTNTEVSFHSIVCMLIHTIQQNNYCFVYLLLHFPVSVHIPFLQNVIGRESVKSLKEPDSNQSQCKDGTYMYMR